MKTEETTNNLSTEGLKKNDLSEKPVKNEKSAQKNSFFQATIKKIGFALLFLLIGALIIGLSLYLPSASALKKAQTELDRLIPLETEYISLQEDYQTASTQAGVYKILSNTNLLHIALADNKTSRINQYIRYVEEELNKLSVPKFPDIPAELSAQFSKVKSYAANDRLKAIDELQDFYNDLLLLIDNLE
jgi:hypothetical protein